MKRILALLLVLITVLKAHSQTYHPFPSSNAVWTERVGQGDSLPVYHCLGLTNKDTILNIVPYHLVFRSLDTIFTPNEVVGGLREDGMKRVFFFDFTSHTERMLYDFGAQPGDTIYSSTPVTIVDYIDSISLGGAFHRRIHLKLLNGTQWTGSWVEGMGNSSLGGLLNSVMLQPTCDCATNILCFKQNNVWVYHNPFYASTNCVNNALVVGKMPLQDVSINVYPNPVNGRGTIRVTGLLKPAIFTIYKLTGSSLRTYSLDYKSVIPIDNSQFAAGIYHYRLNTVDGAVSGRFIVQ
jgi:hypothetical protein